MTAAERTRRQERAATLHTQAAEALAEADRREALCTPAERERADRSAAALVARMTAEAQSLPSPMLHESTAA